MMRDLAARAKGEGHLVAKDTVQVGDQRVQGRNVVLATGSYARTLPGLTIEGRVVTSDQALRLEHVPERVVIIGGSAGITSPASFSASSSAASFSSAMPIGPCRRALRNWRTTGSWLDSSISRGPNIARCRR